MPENTELSYLQLVTSLNISSQIIYSPIKGVIRNVTISWPAGCNFLVEVMFRIKTNQFVPTPAKGAAEGISLDNFTVTFHPNQQVNQNDPVEMFLINHDGVNNHTISAVVEIEQTTTGL